MALPLDIRRPGDDLPTARPLGPGRPSRRGRRRLSRPCPCSACSPRPARPPAPAVTWSTAPRSTRCSTPPAPATAQAFAALLATCRVWVNGEPADGDRPGRRRRRGGGAAARVSGGPREPRDRRSRRRGATTSDPSRRRSDGAGHRRRTAQFAAPASERRPGPATVGRARRRAARRRVPDPPRARRRRSPSRRLDAASGAAIPEPGGDRSRSRRDGRPAPIRRPRPGSRPSARRPAPSARRPVPALRWSSRARRRRAPPGVRAAARGAARRSSRRARRCGRWRHPSRPRPVRRRCPPPGAPVPGAQVPPHARIAAPVPGRRAESTGAGCAVVYDIEGPRVRLGVAWFLGAAGRHRAQPARPTAPGLRGGRRAGRPPDRAGLGLGGLAGRRGRGLGAVPVLAAPRRHPVAVATAALGAVVAVGCACAPDGARLPGSGGRGGRGRHHAASSLVPALGAASFVLVRRALGRGRRRCCSVVASAYEVGDYIVGSGASNPIEGPLAGITTATLVALPLALVLVEPYDTGRRRPAARSPPLACPLGQIVASATLPGARAPTPRALRRIDTLLLLAPVWAAAAARVLPVWPRTRRGPAPGVPGRPAGRPWARQGAQALARFSAANSQLTSLSSHVSM